jgi:hypothetical protein
MEGTLVSTVDAAHKFFEESFFEAKGSSLHSSYRRPGVIQGSLSAGQDDFAIVVSGQGWLQPRELADIADSLL